MALGLRTIIIFYGVLLSFLIQLLSALKLKFRVLLLLGAAELP